MGASGWDYYVPYEADPGSALKALRLKVFTEGDYWWARGDFGKAASDYANRPATMKELFSDEWVQESGTHSILDMHEVIAEGDEHSLGTVKPVSQAEALRYAGTDRPTREHVAALEQLPAERWQGWCVVLHDSNGEPNEIYFWGYSGD